SATNITIVAMRNFYSFGWNAPNWLPKQGVLCKARFTKDRSHARLRALQMFGLYRLSVSWLLRLTAIWVFPFRGSGYESYGCASEVGMAFRLRRRSNLVVKPDNPFARQPGPSCDIPTLMRANGIRAVQSVILYLAKELRTPSPLTTNPAT